MRTTSDMRKAAVILVPLVTGIATFVLWDETVRWSAFFTESYLTHVGDLLPQYVPWNLPRISLAEMLAQGTGLGVFLGVSGALLCVLFALGLRRGRSSRSPFTRRQRRLPVRIGVLALLVALAQASFLEASDALVLHELGYWRHMFAQDLASTPWGSLGYIAGGFALFIYAFVTSLIVGVAPRRDRS